MISSQDESLSQEQQLFLQWILSQKCVLFEDAFNHIREAFGFNIQETDFDTWIRIISATINRFSLQLGKRYFDEDDNFYLTVWNSQDDKISQLATTFNPVQIAVFKHIIYLCLDTEAHSISSTQLIHEIWEGQNSRPGTHMTKTQIQNLINELLKLFWLFKRSDDTITLGPRAKFELHNFLKNTPEIDNDIKECYLCKEIITTPKTICCNDSACAATLHLGCFERFHSFRTNAQNINHNNCPKCTKLLE